MPTVELYSHVYYTQSVENHSIANNGIMRINQQNRESGVFMVDRRVIKTKNLIKEAFVELIMDKKDPKITITEIANVANIDRKTFYLHYDSIESVFIEIGKERIQYILVNLEKSMYFQNLTDVNKILEAINIVVLKDIDFYRKLSSNTHYYSFWKLLENMVKETIIEVYNKFIDIPKEEFNIFSGFYASGIISIYMSWLNKQYTLNIDEIGEIIGKIIFNGFSGYIEV